MQILTRGGSGSEPSAVLLAMPLETARGLADRVATSWSAKARNGLDEQGLETLSQRLTGELPQLAADQVATLSAAVADSARALAASRWREQGRNRPDHPAVDSSAVRGALLLHLHGRPDGSLAAALQQHHEEGLLLQSSRRRRRTPPPTREEVQRFARALRAHEEQLSLHLATLDGQA